MSAVFTNAEVIAETKTAFKQHFGYTPAHVVVAPGRVALLGDFAEEHEGLALTAAVHRGVHIAISPRTDGKIELISSTFPSPDVFWVTDLKPNPATLWTSHVKAVLAQLRARGVHFSGFNAAVHSSIPPGLGLGAGAALRVATALAVLCLFPFSLTEAGVTVPPKRDERGRLPPLTRPERFHLARLCAAAAPETQGGFVDALTSLLGKAWSVLNVDCRFQSVDATPLAGEALIVCDTGQRRPSSLEQTSARRSLGQSAAVKLRAKMLRAVEPKQLAVGRDQLSPDEFAVASHIVGEIQRVAAAERALRDDDHRQLGQFLLQSHDSARTFLNANRPELDLLVELARAHPGCLGARQLGQGEGGATLNLVAYHQAEDFLKSMTRQYSQRAGGKLNAFVCQIVDGAA